MHSISPAFIGLVLFALIAPGHAATNGQFIHWYDGMGREMEPILSGNCSEEYSKVLSDPNRGGDNLVDCILEYLSESKKAEMAIVSVIMGLLPVAMQLIGPKIPDLSSLALQRPILALFIAIGSPCASFEQDFTGLEPLLKAKKQEPLWPAFLDEPPLWLQASISVLQYIISGGAAINAIILGHALTFRAITLVSTITGTYGNKLEAFAPLLWIFLSIPIYILGSCALRIHNGPAKHIQSGFNAQPLLERMSHRVKRWTKRELTPCAFMQTANQDIQCDGARSDRTRYVLLLLHWLVRAGIWIDVIYGVIVFSSIIFLTLFDALEITGRFLAGSVLCRLVLAFEIYGLRTVSQRKQRVEDDSTTSEPAGQKIGSDQVRSSVSIQPIPSLTI